MKFWISRVDGGFCLQMKELHSLGFRDVSQCEEALRQSGGQVKGALSLLQRPLLEPFHQRIWTNQSEPQIDPGDPDKQVRRQCLVFVLFVFLTSWSAVLRGCADGCWRCTTCPAGGAVSWCCLCSRSRTSVTPWRTWSTR